MVTASMLEAERVPLTLDSEGTIRVSGTRVTLETIFYNFEEGASAEEIASRFTVLKLADVYTVLGFYLRHIDEVKTYVQQRAMEAEEIRTTMKAQFPSEGLRERLLARLAKEKQPVEGL